MPTFTKVTALKQYLHQTQEIPLERLTAIILHQDSRCIERMIVDEEAPKVALGYSTTTYQGIQPGRGKVFSTIAHTA